MIRSRFALAAFSCGVLSSVLGCTQSAGPMGVTPAAIGGKIMGGQQPVAGASIQLFAVSTTANGGSSTTELTAAVTSSDGTGQMNANANPGNSNNSMPVGSFSITGDYTCPSADTQVYITASGGNPGLSAGTNNTALRLMAALGSCGALTASTYININEVTTVGAVAALSTYMTAYNAVGSANVNLPSVKARFNVVPEYVNNSLGTAPGPNLPAGYDASATAVNTLADIIAGCINSAGDTGSGSVCHQLFQASTPSNGTAPTDTVGALIDILNNPTNNVGAIFNMGTAQGPFNPTLLTAPPDWSLPILPIPLAPTFFPIAGSYASAQNVTITSPTAGTTIYYTLDGSAPTTSSAAFTGGSITVSSNKTLKAIAVNRVAGATGSASYTITGTPAPPMYSLAPGAYTGVQIVGISSPTLDATIYYTTDGSTPTTSSNIYASPLALSRNTTINAIAVAANSNSAVSSAAYSFQHTSGVMYTVAGGGNVVDGLPATAQLVYQPGGMVADMQGNLYFADYGAYRIRKISAAGVITTVAGTGTFGSGGDGGPATSATFSTPRSVALDSAGNLYIADTNNHRVRMVSAATGIITTVAGTGTGGYSATQDGGPATSAQLDYPYDITLDASDNLYIADTSNQRIRKVTASTGIITTIAGTGAGGYNGDNIAATGASVNNPRGIAVDAAGNVYFADTSNSRVRMISAVSGMITTVAGTGVGGYSAAQDSGPATSAQLYLPYKVTIDVNGNLYIADSNNYRIRKVNVTNGTISTIAGTGSNSYAGDGGAATSASLVSPQSVCVDSNGNVYIPDQTTFRIRKITASTGIITTYAGNGASLQNYVATNVPATQTRLASPSGVVEDAAGNLYISDNSGYRIRKVNAGSGIIITIAGTGTSGFTPDGNPASGAAIGLASAITLDHNGNVYFADATSHQVREINASTGILSTIAGTGASGFSGDNGSATSAQLNSPSGLAFDTTGNLYIADSNNHRIRMVNTAGVISTIAGTGTNGYTAAQDGGAATNATLNFPRGVAVDASGNLFIADTSNQRIRKVSGGIITTIAGTGTAGYTAAQDGGPATSATLSSPRGLSLDTNGNLYVADSGNSLVRKINFSTGTITSVAGTGAGGYNGEGLPATSSQLYSDGGVFIDSNNNLFISDASNGRVRVVYP